MHDDLNNLSDDYLTKTELFVLDCRRRGMSDTAIRRLLQLSAAEAVAFGLMPAQTTKPDETASGTGERGAAETWPQSAGRRKPFARAALHSRRLQATRGGMRRNAARKFIANRRKQGDKV